MLKTCPPGQVFKTGQTRPPGLPWIGNLVEPIWAGHWRLLVQGIRVRPASAIRSATAILDRFLHHAELITITGKSYRLRNKTAQKTENSNEDKNQTCKQQAK